MRPTMFEIYTLSLHDALPIWLHETRGEAKGDAVPFPEERSAAGGETQGTRVGERLAVEIGEQGRGGLVDRKSTRLNSSHLVISYAVFCLKKKKQTMQNKSIRL